MYRYFMIALFVLGFLAVYVSCSDDSTPTEDANITETEVKDVITTKDEVEIKDNFETNDSSGDVNTNDTVIVDDNITDIGMEDFKDVEEDTGVVDVGTDEGITDTNPSPPAKILPGLGIDIIYNGNPRQIRIGDNYGVLKDIETTVPDSRFAFYLRADSLHFDMLFADTDESKTLTDDDKLIRIILLLDFNGETEGKTKIGDPVSKAKTEFGPSDNTSNATVEGSVYTFDFYFKKGINVGSDSSQKITGFTIYRPQNVVPSGDIEYDMNSLGKGTGRVLGITTDIALIGSSATSISEMRNILGPEDIKASDELGKFIFYNYISIGFTAIDSQTSSGDVKTITLYPPYFGKLKDTNLSLGSSRNDIDAYFSKRYGPAKSIQQGDATINCYRVGTKDFSPNNIYDICLGFIYDQNDRVASILVGLPVKQ